MVGRVVAVVGVVFVLLVGVALLVTDRAPAQILVRLRMLVPGQSGQVLVAEGQDRFEIARRLEEREICAERDFIAVTRDPELLAELELSSSSAEGYLAPATYKFLKGTSAHDVVRAMVGRRRLDLAPLLGRPLPPPLKTTQDAVILASLVEREARRPNEYPRIARVFLNRLLDEGGETKGRLQSDPTAIYGCLELGAVLVSCGDRVGRPAATPEMLRDSQNPYNTYRIKGLPPGPIGNPSAQALEAIWAPAEGDELYFVADGRGAHVFSKTFAEHRRAIERLNELRKGGVLTVETVETRTK